MAKVEIYTQFGCGFCARAVKLLRAKGVAFEETDVTFGGDARAAMAKRAGGSSSAPQIFIEGKHIGGSDDLLALENAGKLDAMFAA